MQKIRRLAIVATHPIQYYAPIFKLLSESDQINLKVFYTWGESSIKKYDFGFGKIIEWDIPLFDGYGYEFLPNITKNQGTHHFNGITNPDSIQQIDIFQPDVILIYGWGWHSHLKIIRHYEGKVPLWFRGDSTLLDQKPGFKNLLRNIFLKWVYKHIDKAFYVGKSNKAYFLKYGLKEHQLIFAHHAIDNLRFETNRSDEATVIRQTMRLAGSDILVLFAGKLDIKKDPFLLLNAFSRIKKLGVHLLFVGNGILEDNLKATVKNNNISNVFFIDFQNQKVLPTYYQACDLFCLPSKGPGETWGLAINEAMACGKAVLVSDKVGCALDLVEDGVNGMIFKSNSIEDLQEKLTYLLGKGKDGLKSMGQASLKIIKPWTFANQVKAIEKEISKLK